MIELSQPAQCLRRRGQAVQAELNGFLKDRSPDLERSRPLLGNRLKELLLQKVLLLGEAGNNPQEMTAAERKRVLSAVDRESGLIEKQLALLSQSVARDSITRP
jgi:hypothetical protein